MRATPDGMKVCSKCRKNRDLVWFSKAKTKADGLDNNCRECKRYYDKEHHLQLKETHWKTIVMVGTRQCSKCGETKDVNLFSASASHKYGRQSRCKVCHNAGVKASQRKRFEKDPEFYLINKREISNMSYRRGGWVIAAENYVNRQRENR